MARPRSRDKRSSWALSAAELALAVGLAIPRWQKAACVLGAGFHMVLALDAPHIFYNFSCGDVRRFMGVCAGVYSRCLDSPAAGRAIFGRFHFLGGFMR